MGIKETRQDNNKNDNKRRTKYLLKIGDQVFNLQQTKSLLQRPEQQLINTFNKTIGDLQDRTRQTVLEYQVKWEDLWNLPQEDPLLDALRVTLKDMVVMTLNETGTAVMETTSFEVENIENTLNGFATSTSGSRYLPVFSDEKETERKKEIRGKEKKKSKEMGTISNNNAAIDIDIGNNYASSNTNRTTSTSSKYYTLTKLY